MFRQYKKRPVIVEAVQFTDADKDKILNELTGRFAAVWDNGEPAIKVETIHGDEAIVRLGDWIVKEAKPGYYYPVKNDVFANTYDNA